MKNWTISALLLAACANAHAIFQKVSVNGVDQGHLVGVRSPYSNSPIQNVNDGAMACNSGLYQPVSSRIITVPAGARVGAFWRHTLTGGEPIAASHHGPIQVYLAKVSNAATSGTSGLKWFKIASDGLNGGKWGVDNMYANGGWAYFTMPSCIAPGNYLMRVELLALHSAYASGEAQFYMACAQINVTGSGIFTPSSTVNIPGVYVASDPGILINIYDGTGTPNNSGRPYTAPGPAVITCPSGGGGTTTRPVTTSAGGGGGGGTPLYGQCGGQGWTGPTTCAAGTCKVSNQWYSQCLP